FFFATAKVGIGQDFEGVRGEGGRRRGAVERGDSRTHPRAWGGSGKWLTWWGVGGLMGSIDTIHVTRFSRGQFRARRAVRQIRNPNDECTNDEPRAKVQMAA